MLVAVMSLVMMVSEAIFLAARLSMTAPLAERNPVLILATAIFPN